MHKTRIPLLRRFVSPPFQSFACIVHIIIIFYVCISLYFIHICIFPYLFHAGERKEKMKVTVKKYGGEKFDVELDPSLTVCARND